MAGIVITTGNQDTHIILRGGNKTGPNYHETFLNKFENNLLQSGIKTGLIIDCSHGDSLKDHMKHIDVYK